MKNTLIQCEKKKIEDSVGKKMLKTVEVAKYIGIDKEDVEELIKSGEIKSTGLRNKQYVLSIELAKFLCGENGKNVENKCKETIDFGFSQRYPSTILIEDLGEEEYESMKRRGKGEGSVYFNNNRQVWQVAISLGYDDNGKRLRKIISAKEKSDVLEAMYKFMERDRYSIKENQKANNSIGTEREDITFKEFLDNYLENIKGAQKSRTFRSYIGIAKHIEEGLGSIKMSQLKKKDCQRFINNFTEKTYIKGNKECLYSQSMIHKVYMILKMVVREATEQKLIEDNFMKNIKEPGAKKYIETQNKAFSDEEITKIMSAVKDNPMLKTANTIMLYTGLRPGEVYALKFSDINFESKTISIKRALSFRQDVDIDTKKPIGPRIPIIKEIKNERGGKVKNAKRDLTVSNNVINVIKEWKKYLEKNSKLLEAKKKNGMQDYVFSGAKGNLVLLDYYTQVYKRHLRKKGLSSKEFKLYRFRHTSCTRLFKMGLDPKTVMYIMGDNTLDMVLKVYTSINKEDVLKASSDYANMMDCTLAKPIK